MTDDPGPLQGPNLKWGDPVGTYEIEIVPGGAIFYYRARQPNGGLMQVAIPMSLVALAEMQGLLNMLVFGQALDLGLPDGKIQVN
jgi:hypothetical protein